MDLESENSTLESTGDNDVPNEDDLKIGSNDDGCDLNSNGNGHYLPAINPVETKEYVDKLNLDEHKGVSSVGKGTEIGQLDAGSPLSPLETSTKRKGLKKWRRIRREVTKDNSGSVDVTKILKRNSENLMNSLEVEMKQKSEGSVSSTNALINNNIGADTFSVEGSSSIQGVAGSSMFSVGADSDNSKDRSSKSSTAASVPRSRHDPSRASGHSREKHKTKQFGGKHLGAFQVDTSKKPWVEAVENSTSSLESDSRSYSSVFMQGSSSVISNGHTERLMGYDSEHGYDGLFGEQLSAEGLPASSNRSARGNNDFSQGDAALSWHITGRSKNHQVSENGDPLVDCVRMLRSAQESLEQEIQKFGELGKDLRPLDYSSIKADDSDALETKSTGQAENIRVLEKQLKEASDMLKEKESRITELEAKINNMKLSHEDLGRNMEVQQMKYKKIEAEMEGLFKQKMEAEIKYLAFADKSRIAEKQVKSLAIAQLQVTKTDGSESLKDSAYEVGKLQTRAAKLSFCFIVQLVVLIFVLRFLASQRQKSEMVMPT